jgi:two-component system chemotaxis response regulator CheY
MIDYHIKVLVAEDFATMRKILCTTLRKIGFDNVVEAEDGLAAWNIIHNDNIGLVVTDWHMPNMSGLELLQKIRQNPQTASLPVLMVTVEDHKDLIIAAVKAGVTHYIFKPFNLKVLQEKIAAIFRKKEPDKGRAKKRAQVAGP